MTYHPDELLFTAQHVSVEMIFISAAP